MNDIERLFQGDRPVPGLRTSHRRASVAVEGSPLHPRIQDRAESDDDGASVEPAGEVRTPTVETVEQAGSLAEPEGLESSSQELEADVRARRPREDHLAVVEPVRLRPGPSLVFAHDPNHPRSERVRLLRTELLLRQPQANEINAIALLSARAGEGRSLLAAELALSFAQLECETLLVDVDFRRPRQHVLFGCQSPDGLAQAIAATRSPTFNRVEGFPSLSLVTAGACPPNPLDLLMDWRFENLMREWGREFEFIVVDTPPVAQFADALAVATVVGRVLLVNRAKHTPYKDVREMLRRLASTEADILGSVLNHF